MKRKCALPLMVAVVLALIPAGNVFATVINIPLNNFSIDNQIAVPCTGCPTDGGLSFWHFVVSPNNGDSEFITFHLNLGDATTYDTTIYIGNGSQLDNVFVEVPSGKTLESLMANGSTATIDWNGDAPQPKKFQLSGVVQPVPEPSTLPLLGTGLVGLGLAGWRRVRK